LGLINSGVEQGAKLVVDGRGFKLQGYENGFFVGPSLFDNVTPEDGHLQAGDLRAGPDHRPHQIL
jgi:acyl-CoA reductase-like NAD-dependent aldehyde dehydrogenase